MRQAIRSGDICPMRFGTSSPSTMEKYVMSTTTITTPMAFALYGLMPKEISTAAIGCASADSPTMPERMPIEVMPT